MSITVIGVRFKEAGKIYYFDPDQMNIQAGDHVIVETARGIEYGSVVVGLKQVPEEEIVPPLKKVIRVATPEDDAHVAANAEYEKEAFQVCLEKIENHQLPMKLIDVPYDPRGAGGRGLLHRGEPFCGIVGIPPVHPPCGVGGESGAGDPLVGSPRQHRQMAASAVAGAHLSSASRDVGHRPAHRRRPRLYRNARGGG